MHQLAMPPNEVSRLKTLLSYEILDTTAEQVFDGLALLATTICATPMAVIGFTDANRQWFKSRVGVLVPEIDRAISFCGHTILQNELFIVEDALMDERFATNPLVISDPGIRFYAGAPLLTPDGHALGAICVLDREPRVLQPSQAAALLALSRQVVTHLEERRRIARELHNTMAQYLPSLILELNSLRDGTKNQPATHARLERLLKITNEFEKEAHHLARELRPVALDDLGLQTALPNYLAQWSERAKIAVDFHTTNLDQQRLLPEIEATLYRIVQEATTNVMKHSQARRVSIIVEGHANDIQLIIEDDGSGFEAERLLHQPNPQRCLGLIGMQERVAMVAGTLEIESAPGRGTTLFVRIPISVSA